jgi:integrative and conjugative element protein (TIGR02256 family)
MSHLPRLLKLKAGDLLVSADVLKGLYGQGWDAYPNETGGVLLGHSNGLDMVVSHVIGPGPGATHEPTRFEPDHEWQAERVAELWIRDPSLEYLGDWHTHPGGSATPSKLDKSALEVIAGSADAQQPRPVMVILGLSAALAAVTATRLSRSKFANLRVCVAPEASL